MAGPRRLVAFALVSLALTGGLAAQQQPQPSVPEIQTQMTARRDVQPDVAIVSFAFSAVGKTPLEAGQRVAARADSIRKALERLGIPRDSLLNGSRWYWWRGRIEPILGPGRYIPAPNPRDGGVSVQDTSYRAHDALQVRVWDMKKVGPVIDVALGFGVTQFEDIRFRAVNTAKVEDAVLREATQGARAQAVTMADAGGVQLGRLLLLSTSKAYEYGNGYELVMSSRGTSGSGNTEVIAPLVPVGMTVYGRWEVKSQ